MKKVAIIGTVGVPANYGGYETLAENLLTYKKSEEIEYTVYCSSKSYSEKLTEYKGAKLKYVNLKANGWQAVLYDMTSIIRAWRKSDVIVSLGTVGCYILPMLKLFSPKKVVAVNLDGMDNKRAKWNGFSQAFIGAARWCAIKFADIAIADNKAIQDYLLEEFNRESELIEYGGDNAIRVEDDEKLITKYNLKRGEYCFKVARIEPENNIAMILEAFSKLPNEILVLVGNWNKSEFGRSIREKYASFKNIMTLDPIYQSEEINLLRGNCKLYIHGHSAGGTNPSLVEAMNLGLPIFAYDVVFNRFTTEDKAIYFGSADMLINSIQGQNVESLKTIATDMSSIAKQRYTWSIICKKYEAIILNKSSQCQKN
ncbi:MAG: DUF1972 domain-containing protein [Rikenellaceae bacterium]